MIVLARLIYSAFISTSAPAVDSTQPAVTMAWKYIGELLFNMLVLTGMVKGADRIVREMFSCSGKLKLDTEGVIIGQRMYNGETAKNTSLDKNYPLNGQEVYHEIHSRRTTGHRAANI